ncbi:MAG: hypothetical protein ACE15C_01370 [Phycisphaerae bacterium]
MKATIIGGGSYGWTFGFMRQFIDSEPLRADGLGVTLMDVNPEALALVGKAVDKYKSLRGVDLPVEHTGDMDRALDGADYVIVCISTGGLEAMRHDIEIPERYGIWHTVGDTVGPGGWLRAVRNVPVFHDLGRRIKSLCPDAWLINVSNPLTVLTRTPAKCFGVKAIGMCPGAEHHARMLARLAGLEGEVDCTVTGIDHGSWLTRCVAGGRDVLAALKAKGWCRSDDKLPTRAETPDAMAETAGSRAIFAVWREIGYMPCLSDRHSCENWPWFLAAESDRLPFGIKRTSIAERYVWRDHARKRLEDFIASGTAGSLGHGDDPVVAVIESLAGHRSFLYGSNYANIGQIPELPLGAVVETRCRFDGAGVHPLASPMPEILRALVLPHIIRQEAVIGIALSGSFDELVALVMTDPLCSRLPMGRCREMVREMVLANAALIPNKLLLE